MSQSVLRVDRDLRKGTREPVTEPLDTMLVLSRPLGDATWLGRLDDTLVAARRVTDRVGDGVGDRAAVPPLEAVSRSQPCVPEPRNIVACYGTRLLDGAAWTVWEYVAGVSLDRLLRVAILTPAQAVHVAAAIFTGLGDLHDAGLVHGSLEARKVMIGKDGRVRLSGWAVAGRQDERARRADLDAACAVVYELVRNADRPVGRHHPGANGLLVRLERLAAGGTPADARSAAASLAEALATAKGVRSGAALLDGQLAALADAAVRHAPAADDVPPAPPRRRVFPAADARQRAQPKQSGQPDQNGQPKPSGQPKQSAQPKQSEVITGRGPLSDAAWEPPRRGRRAVAIAVGVVLIVAGIAYVTERGPITSLLDRVLHRTTASSAAQTPGSHHATTKAHLHAIPDFGPRSAHAVRRVVLRHPVACHTGHACPLTLHIRLAPAPHARHVAWRIVSINRCTGNHRVRRHGSVLVPAGHRTVTVKRPLVLRSSAAAAVAVTTRPARAASRPILVPPRHASC